MINIKLDKKAKNVISKTADFGSDGPIIVTELPQVGEEHTIYELHQNVEPTYNWVAEINEAINNGGFNPVQGGGYLLVVETYEDMLAKVNEDTYDGNMSVFVYLRAEDRLFEYWLNKDAGEHMYTEYDKVSNYTFKLKETNFYVLKSIRVDFGTPEHPLEDPIYYGTLYNGVEFSLDQWSGNDKAFILHQATFDGMYYFNASGIGVHQVSTLPTAEEAVANYLDELIANKGFILVEVDNQVKSNSKDNGHYHWGRKKSPQGPIYNFFQYVEGDEEPIYTGDLTWNDIPSEIIFTEIPYQDIFNGNLSEWVFKPEQGGEKVSYWIYTNSEWMNIDEIGQPSNVGTLYAETDSFVDLSQEKFYANGKELEVEFVETTPEGAEIATGYAIIKGVPIDNSVELTVSVWPTNGINYNKQWFSQECPVDVIGAGLLELSYMMY